MRWDQAADEYLRRASQAEGGFLSLPAEWQRELVALCRALDDVNNGAYLQFLVNHGRHTYVYAKDTSVKPVLVHVPHDEFSQPYLDVFVGRGEDRRLVTHIESLSPSNKAGPNQGRALYLEKQREILGSNVNLIEFDFLRAGRHTTAVPLESLRQQAPAFDYHICAHRFNEFTDYLVYPIRLPDRLPRIDIPLLQEDGAIQVDLQAIFDRCYDAGPYSREIDYEHDEPEPPLNDEQQAFRRSVLKQRTT